jgi:hypothetical protein
MSKNKKKSGILAVITYKSALDSSGNAFINALEMYRTFFMHRITPVAST